MAALLTINAMGPGRIGYLTLRLASMAETDAKPNRTRLTDGPAELSYRPRARPHVV